MAALQFIMNNRHQINNFANTHGFHHIGHPSAEQIASAAGHHYSFSPPINKPLGLSILIKDENNKYVVQSFNTQADNPQAFYDRNQNNNNNNKPNYHNHHGGHKWPFYHYKPSEFGSKPPYAHLNPQGGFSGFQSQSGAQIFVTNTVFNQNGGAKPQTGLDHHVLSTARPEIILHPQPSTELTGNYHGDDEQTMQYGFSHGFRGNDRFSFCPLHLHGKIL